jgi:hypothetical protein
MVYPETIEQTIEGHVFKANKCYTDRFGNAWYGFEDPLRIPGGRALAGEVSATWCELNMTPDDIRMYFKKMRESGNRGDIVHMFRLFDCMEERLEWACEDKSLLGLAKVYFTINDEPLNAPTQNHTALKDEIFDTDADCRAFFLLRAHALIKVSSEFSPADILNYSQVMRALEVKRIERLATSSVTTPVPAPKSSSNASTTSTNKSGSPLVKPSPRARRS